MKRGVALLYPQRKRCYRCRRFFGFLILAGLWCSYRCAGHPEPSRNPAAWPRGHFVPWGWGRRKAKKVFDDEAEALEYPTRGDKSAYLCGYCLTWHIGTTWSGDLSGVPQGEESKS